MKKMLLLCILLFPTSVFGIDIKADPFPTPETKIIAPTNPVDFGEVVILKVEKVTPSEGLQGAQYHWKVLENNSEKKASFVSEDSTTVIFGSGIKPTKFLVILTANYLFVKKDGDKVVEIQMRNSGVLTREIVVGDSLPPPIPVPVPPNPGPNPQPDPDLKGVSKLVYEWLKDVKSEKKVKIAKEFASNAQSITSKIAAGVVKNTLGDVLADIREMNRMTLANNGESDVNWRDPFFVKLQDYLYDIAKKNNLKMDTTIDTVWLKGFCDDVAMGLNAVK